jgi:hypothetical protein
MTVARPPRREPGHCHVVQVSRPCERRRRDAGPGGLPAPSRGSVAPAPPQGPATSVREVGGGGVLRQWKLSPQAQEPPAFGLSIVKPCFSMVSTKSIVAPPRYGPLIRSTMTSTPPYS